MITLATLEDATEQQVFDQVVKHLLTQYRRSLDVMTGNCRYRDWGKLTCAAGCLISENEYDESFEEQTWDGLRKMTGVNTHSTLITDLQIIHDYNEPHKWTRLLKEHAAIYKLKDQIVDLMCM